MAFIPLPKQFHPSFAYGEQPKGFYELDPDFAYASAIVFAGFWADGRRNAVLGGLPPTFTTAIKAGQGIVQTGTEVAKFTRPKRFRETNGSGVFDFTGNGNSPAAEGRFFQMPPSNSPFEILRNSSNTSLIWRIGAGSNVIFTVPNIWDGLTHRVAIRWTENGGEMRGLSVDRAAWFTSDIIMDPNDTKTDPISILNNATGIREGEGDMSFLIFFDQVLPQVVLDDLKYNPVQVLRPVDPMPLFLPSVALDLNLISIMHHTRQLPHPWGDSP